MSHKWLLLLLLLLSNEDVQKLDNSKVVRKMGDTDFNIIHTLSNGLFSSNFPHFLNKSIHSIAAQEVKTFV
jgi:hypothetical protein